jgi:hypothetical protein
MRRYAMSFIGSGFAIVFYFHYCLVVVEIKGCCGFWKLERWEKGEMCKKFFLKFFEDG